jgi:hypothetical protein
VQVHSVSREERFQREGEYTGLGFLDDGERDLWIHALGRQDAWVLCGPDVASIRFGCEVGYGSRLISLEELLGRVGFRPAKPLKEHHTRKWLQRKINEISLEKKFGEIRRMSGKSCAG